MSTGVVVTIVVVVVSVVMAVMVMVARYMGVWTWLLSWLRAGHEEKTQLCGPSPHNPRTNYLVRHNSVNS